MVILILSGCSIVFDGSISGQIVDKEIYAENDGTGAGISEMTVYLYTDEKSCTADFAAWDKGAGKLPEEADEQAYFTSTRTDENGAFSFTGFVWKSLFPEFGKTADRKEVFLLFYHKDYGLQKNSESLRAVSDNTARLPLIELGDCYNTRWLCGKVNDYNDSLEDGLSGVQVKVYVPEYWAYKSDGSIDSDTIKFGDEPDYLLTTDNDGKWSVEAHFPMMPSSGDNKKTGIAAVVPVSSDYILKPEYNSENTGTFVEKWDFDKDNKIETCLLSGLIKTEEDETVRKGSVMSLSDIDLRKETDNAVIAGRIIDDYKDLGEAGVTVNAYLPEKFIQGASLSTSQLEAAGYNSDEHFYIQSSLDGVNGYFIYKHQASVSSVTDNNGDFSVQLEYKLLPDEDASKGLTRAVITMKKSEFETSSLVDANLVTGKDIDGDAALSDSDDVYYLTTEISRNKTIELPFDLKIRRTEFHQVVEGFYESGVVDFSLNGKTVTLVIDENGQVRTYTTKTKNKVYSNESTPIKPGYFEFRDVFWEEPLTSADPDLYQCSGTFTVKASPELTSTETIFSSSDSATVFIK